MMDNFSSISQFCANSVDLPHTVPWKFIKVCGFLIAKCERTEVERIFLFSAQKPALCPEVPFSVYLSLFFYFFSKQT